MRKLIFISFILIFQLLANYSFVHAEQIQVTAEVPLTEEWKKAISENSQVLLSHDNPPKLTIYLKGTEQVPVPKKDILIVISSDYRLLYQSSLKTDQLGTVQTILPDFSDEKYQISAFCNYDGHLIPLHQSEELNTTQDLVKHFVDLVHITSRESEAVNFSVLVKESRFFQSIAIW